MRERTFEIDRIFLDGAECLVQGVKYAGDPYRRTRLTMSADGISYRIEGYLTPLHASQVASLLPKPHRGLRDVEATVFNYGIYEWRVTVDRCPASSCVVEGRTYPAAGFGVAKPMARNPNSFELPEEAPPPGMRH